MNPLLSADLGAAVVLMSEETARRYARKGSRPVYFLGGGYAEDRQRFVIQKSDFTSSLPLKTAADKAIRRSNLRLDDIECFDLYSCFHSAVSIARRMLELKDDDPRPLTLTGGEGFFGGPGNNYSLHAVATLADAIASGRTDNGMITAIGWFMHKHAAGIYGAEPGDTDLSYHDLEDETNYMAGNPPVDIVNEAWGEGVIETYTVVYSREGAPSYAIVYGRTQKGLRFVAQDHPGEGLIEALTSRNQVGARVRLRFDRLQERNLAMLI
jgi:acetyl-CoA C-acetyltransferase